MLNRINSILFLGDVVPYKPFKFRNIYKTVINLECPITRGGNPEKGKINLSVRENYLRNIFGNNLFCASIGNNHILDFGGEGLNSTLAELDKIEVNWFGLESESKSKNNPLTVEFNNIKIAFIAAVCKSTSPSIESDNIVHLSLLNVDDIISRVSKIRKHADRVIVYIHWGIEESSYPALKDISIARKLIEAGVDLVVGSHAHAPQPVEKYKDGIIAYNLGNFIMPEMKNVPSYFDDTGMPQNSYNKRLMIWNRISWGLVVDMVTLEYRVKKFIFSGNRVVELPFTPLDRFIIMKQNSSDGSYESSIRDHLNKRESLRRLKDLIYEPHVPQKLRKLLWK